MRGLLFTIRLLLGASLARTSCSFSLHSYSSSIKRGLPHPVDRLFPPSITLEQYQAKSKQFHSLFAKPKKQPTDARSPKNVNNAAMNLVDAVTSTVGSSQLSLQNKNNQLLADIKTKVVALEKATREANKTAREADKMRRIEFALENVSLVTYNFQVCVMTEGGHTRDKNADEVLGDILLSFRQGRGHDIDSYISGVTNDSYYGYAEVKEEWYQCFMDKVSDKLYKLLGQKPRIAPDSKGTMYVWYQ
ncbi:expressed unknown protein [Seminavis robusta]|uniref:Uncharacterized protein n=1 Tax=Seminavis robusta TaxID=568900 RepID=A0A9N8HWY1_9STRA|nr:expressed unknown protein [Seminavis robusta]|eukprot:Sro2305_g322660.1 n/a (247) ;mRNA; r:11180-11991